MLDLFRPKISRIYGPVSKPDETAAERERREKRRAYFAEYHRKHRGKRLAQMKALYLANPQKYIDAAREWKKKHPAKFTALKKRWDAENRNKALRIPKSVARETDKTMGAQADGDGDRSADGQGTGTVG